MSKRTREESETEGRDIDRRPFSVRHDASDPFAKPRIFTPICLLPRSRLPLAFLDTAHDGSRIFTAEISVLEGGEEGNVLIVEEEKEGRVLAVERVCRRRYALCRLVEGVKREDLVGRSGGGDHGAQRKSKRRAVGGEEGGKPWWVDAGVDVDVEKMKVKKNMPRLSMLRKQDTASLESVKPAQTVDSDTQRLEDASGPKNNNTPKAAPATSQDHLEELARSYLDALYLSRTPIAYFVKGPLARARAAFASQPADLVAFLRTSILSIAVADKKYRDSIPEHIKDLPLLDTPEKSKRKKKRKWKPTRDKSGFFVSEKDCLEQWWRSDNDHGTTLGSAEKLDDAIRRRSQRLRSRETFLQVILILETMALEATTAKSLSTATAAAKSQNVDSQAEESQAAAGQKKSRRKKEVDIAEVLDTWLDRLNMWSMIDPTSPTKTADKDDGDEESNDELKNFACEVVIPFFSARINEQAYAASKKLGGPKAPPKTKSKVSVPRKPGEPAVRQPPSKEPRKPLSRVSSDTLNQAGKRAPSLHRAATDSDTLSNMIKREMSETPPLDSIPLSRSRSQSKTQPGVKKRPSLLESLVKREVDLTAIAQANEAKLKKKSELEEKMRDAINTLKKPNRARAVEETAKNADESFARAIAKGKSNGQRKASDKNAVAITATPRQVQATPAPKRHIYQGLGHSLSSGDVSVVPATSARQRALPDQIPSSSFAVPQTNHRPRNGDSLIEETPSRGFAKFMPPALSRTPGTLLESPTATRKSQIQATPAKVSRMPSLTETPLAKVPGSTLKGRTYSPIKNLAASPPKLDSRDDSGLCLNNDAALYNALGWDDDEYEELP